VTHTALMTSRLKAALPTIVEGPSSPARNSFLKRSMTLSKISGALEPKAMRVRLATVSFQTLVVSHFSSESPTLDARLATLTNLFLEVIFSMAAMKTSLTMATPMNSHTSPMR